MRDRSIDVTEAYGKTIKPLMGKNLEYVGLSEDEVTQKNYIYSDGTYEYYFDPIHEYVSRIVRESSLVEGYYAEDMEAKSSELYAQFMPKRQEQSWKTEISYTEEIGFDVMMTGYQGNEVNGDEALMTYDEESQLVIAQFMPNLSEDLVPEEKISMGEAAELGMIQAEYNTMNGIIEGSSKAIKVKFNKVLKAEKKHWQGRWYWFIDIDAQVQFSTRGWVHKFYEVIVDVETGEVVSTGWSLE